MLQWETPEYNGQFKLKKEHIPWIMQMQKPRCITMIEAIFIIRLSMKPFLIQSIIQTRNVT